VLGENSRSTLSVALVLESARFLSALCQTAARFKVIPGQYPL